MKKDKWTSFLWHCLNCGNVIAGHINKKGEIRGICSRCGTYMVRIPKEEDHEIIDVFAPTGSTRL